jgi:hypothetical protein
MMSTLRKAADKVTPVSLSDDGAAALAWVELFETQHTSVAGWIRERRLEQCRRAWSTRR